MVDEIKNLLEKAYLLHTSGKLEEAKVIYEKFIALYPDNPDAINLYAQLLLQTGDLDNSLVMFKKVLELTKIEIINYNIAKVYYIKKFTSESRINASKVCIVFKILPIFFIQNPKIL